MIKANNLLLADHLLGAAEDEPCHADSQACRAAAWQGYSGRVLSSANGIIDIAICGMGLLVPKPIDRHG